MNRKDQRSRKGVGASAQAHSPSTRFFNSLGPSESGNALLQWVAIIALLCLGWFFAQLWKPLDPTPIESPTPKAEGPKNPSPESIGEPGPEVNESPSALDSLSPEDKKISNDIFELFQKCQWSKALDASTAHRVARARGDLQELLDGLGPEHVPMLV